MSQERRRGEVKPVSFKMPMHIGRSSRAQQHREEWTSQCVELDHRAKPSALVRLNAQREAAMAMASTQDFADAVTEQLQRIEVEEDPRRRPSSPESF